MAGLAGEPIVTASPPPPPSVPESATSSCATPRRAIVLGASNVIRNVSTVVAACRSAWGTPLEVMIAGGHGRSYGMWNFVLGYSLPGIAHCGLWQALEHAPPLPTAALLTDIGNDLFYDVPPETILRWVERCLERLRPRCKRLAITELPLERAAQVTPLEFLAMRTLFFPRCRLSRDKILERARCLNLGLAELAQRYHAQVVPLQVDWYGIDPIHFQRRRATTAWREVLAPWCDSAPPAPVNASLYDWCRLRLKRPEVQRFFGWERRQAQPALRDADGNTIWLF